MRRLDLLRCALPLVLAAALLAEEPPQPEVGFAGNYRPGPIPIRVPLVLQWLSDTVPAHPPAGGM